MKRPTPAGLFIGLAIAVPVLIEFRTVLVWLGLYVPLSVYVPAVLLALVALIASLWVFGEGNPTRA